MAFSGTQTTKLSLMATPTQPQTFQAKGEAVAAKGQHLLTMGVGR